jgi:hypothetical protein
MGHAAFERTKEDRRAYKAQLRKEEALWAQMASPVAITHKEVDASKGPGLLRKGRRSSSRALGSSPRAMGMNPRARRTNSSV